MFEIGNELLPDKEPSETVLPPDLGGELRRRFRFGEERSHQSSGKAELQLQVNPLQVVSQAKGALVGFLKSKQLVEAFKQT